jgi:hypothetical protein
MAALIEDDVPNARRNSKQEIDIEFGDNEQVTATDLRTGDICNLCIVLEPIAPETTALMQDEGLNPSGIKNVDVSIYDPNATCWPLMVRCKEVDSRAGRAFAADRYDQPTSLALISYRDDLAIDRPRKIARHRFTPIRQVV